MRKRNEISKEMRGIRSTTKYDVSYIINKMNIYYRENNFSNKILLERLRELKVNNSFIDMFVGGMIGLLLGGIIGDSEIANVIMVFVKEMITSNLIAGIFGLAFAFIIIIVIAFFVVGALNIMKWLYLKMVKSDALTSYLDEKEEEIIRKLLNDR